MFRRRIEKTLLEWKGEKEHLPLVIMGIRQCGKTFIALEFAKKNYKHVVYVNFMKQPERNVAFAGSKEVDAIVLNLSSQIALGDMVLEPIDADAINALAEEFPD